MREKNTPFTIFISGENKFSSIFFCEKTTLLHVVRSRWKGLGQLTEIWKRQEPPFCQCLERDSLALEMNQMKVEYVLSRKISMLNFCSLQKVPMWISICPRKNAFMKNSSYISTLNKTCNVYFRLNIDIGMSTGRQWAFLPVLRFGFWFGPHIGWRQAATLHFMHSQPQN